MRKWKAVFSDIDGTFLDSSHRVSPLTREAVAGLETRGVPFVLVSARSPGLIYPIMETYGISCPVIACSGSLIMDENRRVLWQQGMEQSQAAQIVDFLEEERLPLAWGVYSLDRWIVKDRNDPRIAREEKIVGVRAQEGSVGSLPPGDKVYKLMCICDPDSTLEAEARLKGRFPQMEVVKSSPILIEIAAGGIHKARAVEWLCRSWGIDPKEAAAFGDNYNDLEMLRLCFGVAMGNAPREIREQAAYVTRDNDHEGIYWALREFEMI